MSNLATCYEWVFRGGLLQETETSMKRKDLCLTVVNGSLFLLRLVWGGGGG